MTAHQVGIINHNQETGMGKFKGDFYGMKLDFQMILVWLQVHSKCMVHQKRNDLSCVGVFQPVWEWAEGRVEYPSRSGVAITTRTCVTRSLRR